MATITTQELRQGSAGFLLRLDFVLKGYTDSYLGQTWRVKIVCPDGTILSKTTGIEFLTDAPKISVPIVDFDLILAGTYFYQVTLITGGANVNSEVGSFFIEPSLPEGLPYSTISSAFNYFPIFTSGGALAQSTLRVDEDTDLNYSGGGAKFAGAVNVPDEAYGVAWNGKLEAATKNAIYDKIQSLSKVDIGLGNVDNTSDADKPISTAQQTALNLKASLTGATFSGDVIVPDEVYGGAWDGNLSVPTKNALYDYLQTFVAGIGIGSTVTGGTQNYALFVGASSALAQSNSFVWDETNKRLVLDSEIANTANYPGATKVNLLISPDSAPGAFAYNPGTLNWTLQYLYAANVTASASKFTRLVEGYATFAGTGTGHSIYAFDTSAISNSAQKLSAIVGLRFVGKSQNTGVTGGANLVIGVDSAAGTGNNGGTIDVAYAYRGTIQTYNASTITLASLFKGVITDLGGTTETYGDVRGLDLSGWATTSNITNSYGIYMDTSIDRGSSAKYAIYSLSTSPSKFTGDIWGNKIILGDPAYTNWYSAPSTNWLAIGEVARRTISSGTFTALEIGFLLNITGGSIHTGLMTSLDIQGASNNPTVRGHAINVFSNSTTPSAGGELLGSDIWVDVGGPWQSAYGVRIYATAGGSGASGLGTIYGIQSICGIAHNSSTTNAIAGDFWVDSSSSSASNVTTATGVRSVTRLRDGISVSSLRGFALTGWTLQGSGTAANSYGIYADTSIDIGTTSKYFIYSLSTSPSIFSGSITVPDDAYDATTWNGNMTVPTKNAVRDKIESLAGGGGGMPLDWNGTRGIWYHTDSATDDFRMELAPTATTGGWFKVGGIDAARPTLEVNQGGNSVFITGNNVRVGDVNGVANATYLHVQDSNKSFSFSTGSLDGWISFEDIIEMYFSDTGAGTELFGILNGGGLDSFEIPNSAAPVLNATGEIAVDTTVTDFSHGILKYFGGEELAVIAVPIAALTAPTDGYVIKYNATNDEFELGAGGGGLAIGNAVTGGGANRVLYQNASQNLAANERFQFDGTDVRLVNSTITTVGSQSAPSPALEFEAHGWNPAGTPADAPLKGRFRVTPAWLDSSGGVRHKLLFETIAVGAGSWDVAFAYGLAPAGSGLTTRLELRNTNNSAWGGLIDITYDGIFEFKTVSSVKSGLSLGYLSWAGLSATGYQSIRPTNTYGTIIQSAIGAPIWFKQVESGFGPNVDFYCEPKSMFGLGYNGSDVPGAQIHAVSTTEQFRAGYDLSNYMSLTVGSAGIATFNAVGASAKFVFSDAVEVPDTAYGAGWNGSSEVPTKNAVYDKIESLPGGGAAFINVFKAVSEFRDNGNTGSTLTNDSTLQFTMEANAEYVIKLVVCYSASGNGDFKFALTGPASPVVVASRRAVGSGARADAVTHESVYTPSTALTSTGETGFIIYDLVVFNGANSGTFAFQWAQNTSHADDSAVYAGSYLSYKRVDA